MTHKLLITSVGSLVGQNLLDALEGRRQNLRILATNSLAEAPGNFRCDKTFLVPPASERAACLAKLRQLIAEERPALVIPARDDDILLLAELAQELAGSASRFLVGTPQLARMMDDKVATHAFAVAHGLPFVDTVASGMPATWQQLAALRERYAFPFIAKPRNGNGSRGIRLLLDDAQLQRNAQLPGYAIQPMIDPPQELSGDFADGLPLFWGGADTRLYAVQGLIDPHGRVQPGFSYRATMVLGRLERLEPCADPQLRAAAERYLQQAAEQGWRGPLNAQFKRDPRQGYLGIELNGRFAGGTSARAHLGYDEVAATLNDWLGAGSVPPRLAGAGLNRAVYKSLCDFPVPAADCRILEQEGVWTASC